MTDYLPPSEGVSFEVVGDCIRTNGAVKSKMTGTSMGGILGVSPWSTPFQVACDLLGLGREDISSKPAVKRGKVMEPIIIEKASKRYASLGIFKDADEVFGRTGDNPHDNPSDWDDPYFGGHIDGTITTPGGTYILEIKTTTSWDKFQNDTPGRNGVPEWYYWQVALYNRFLAGQDVAYLVAAQMPANIYTHPEDWEPTDLDMLVFQCEFNDAEVEDALNKARAWYDEYIANGITPPYNPAVPGDVELYHHLVGLTKSTSEVGELIVRAGAVHEELARRKAELKALEDEKSRLDTAIKDHMLAHEANSVDYGGYTAKITTRISHVLNEKMLASEHPEIDLSDYREEKVTNVFSIKPTKEE